MKRYPFLISLLILLSGCTNSPSSELVSSSSLLDSSSQLSSTSAESSASLEASSASSSQLPSESSEEVSVSVSESSSFSSISSSYPQGLVPSNDDFGQYYASFDFNLTGANLRSALMTLITTGKQNGSYSTAWTTCAATNEVEADSTSVLQIYNRKTDKKANQNNGGATGWNREHVAPQSKISDIAATDQHNLWAADPLVNSTRGNNPMGEVSGGTQVKDSLGRLTDCYLGGGYFEPTDAAKGEVARTLFYMAVCYNLNLANHGRIADLLAWNEQFPPTEWREIRRNNIIQTQYQKNRNPFTDFPGLADLIW